MKDKEMEETNSSKFITSAFFKLMGTMEFDDITVTMICAKAGVSRISFYRTFESKRNILISYFDRMTRHLLEDAPSIAKQKDFLTLFEYLFTVYKNEGDIFRLIDKSKCSYLFLNLLDKGTSFYFSKFAITSDMYTPFLYSGGLFSLCLAWLRNDFAESPKTLAQRYYDFCFVGKEGVLKNVFSSKQ
jgi:AcrR family transcriptional regulator